MDCEQNRTNRMTYEIEVKGSLHENWKKWLDGDVKIKAGVDTTMITVPVPDQSALRGILNQLWDLNLTLVCVTLLEEGENQ